ncbi:MAG TPA: hypothetical protein VFI31_27620 [Pirellulales bacterium]|nr:hypothetical protein [Pirellulales bacterium]
MPTATADVARPMLEAGRRRCHIINLIRDHRPDIRFMKRQIDARCKAIMKFFTPELYLKFNSPDDDVADQADQEWEAAVKAYQKHLDHLRDHIPQQVRSLSELCLHDCEVLAWDEAMEPDPRLSAGPLPVWSAFSVLSLRREGEVLSLNYVLWDKIRHCAAPDDWPFSDSRPCWLYDEIDVAQGPGKFLQRILFSDGATAEIPFAIVLIHAIAWQSAQRHSLPQRA